MMLALATLAAYLQACAPSVAPDTMRAIVSVESRGYIYAINDNTSRVTYCVPGTAMYPCSRDQAAALAEKAVRSGHSIDVGIAQVNSGNFRTYGVRAAQMLDPCENLRIGGDILAGAYRQSTARFAGDRAALWHAIMAYNTGSLYTGEDYVRAVVDAAALPNAFTTVPSVQILRQPVTQATQRVRTSHSDRRATVAERKGPSRASPAAAPLLARGLEAPTSRGDLKDSFGPVITR